MKHIGLDLVRVTEGAAIAASAWVGSGNKLLADRDATDAMRRRLNNMDFRGVIRIGEGKKDQSYGLFKGEEVGNLPAEYFHHLSGAPKIYDIGVDPIDGTTPTVTSGPEATSVIAISEKDSMFDTEEHYMLKLAVGPAIPPWKARQLNFSMPLPDICNFVADALGKPVDKLMVCILNRPRHELWIIQMRDLGVRIKLIQDCDISGAIATCLPDGGIDMQFGVGGAPEAAITAAAMKCLGGFFLAQLWKENLYGPEMNQDELVKGPCAFAATGITDGSLLKGVRWTTRGPVTNSVFMRSESNTVRWLTTNHGN
jgi:fructose-1,6-bisphosphatase II